MTVDVDLLLENAQAVVKTECHKAAAMLYDYIKQTDKIDIKLYSVIVEAFGNYAVNLLRANKLNEAEELVKFAINLAPFKPKLHNNMANVYRKMHAYDKALYHYSIAIALDPDYANGYGNYGQLLHWFGNYDEELRLIEHSMELDPTLPLHHWNHGILQGLMGNFEIAYAEKEWRFKYDAYNYPFKNTEDFYDKFWNGKKKLTQKNKLVVFCEQGFGDALQNYRFLKDIREMTNAYIIFSCREALHDLFEHNNKETKYYDEIAKFNLDPDVDYDWHYPLYSTPHLTGMTIDTIPMSAGYLSPNQEHIKKWQKKMVNPKKFKIGFCCSGRDLNSAANFRNLPIEKIEVLFSTFKDFDWYNLQVEEEQKFDKYSNVYNFADEINSFHDTAGFMQNLNLVISIETSVSHLAGAIGKRAWVMLPKYSAWRWHLDRSDSPWYDEIKLFRQEEQFNWDHVIDAIKKELEGVSHG